MTEIAPVTRQVSIEELGHYCDALQHALRETGLAPDPAAQILERSLSAACIQCGLILSGQEAVSLAAPPGGSPEAPANPKRQRLAQGYCGRAACDSRFYEIRLAPHPEIDWQGILEQKETGGRTPAGVSGHPAPEPASLLTAATRRKRKMFLIVGLVILAVLILIRLFFFGGSIPGFEPESKFQIDPSSVRDHQR